MLNSTLQLVLPCDIVLLALFLDLDTVDKWMFFGSNLTVSL